MKYTKGYKYQLHEDFMVQISIKPKEHIFTRFIDLTPTGILIIRSGYAWDGCSGPTGHPFLLVTANMYDELRARASRSPWSDMKADAIYHVKNSIYPASGDAVKKHYAIRTISMSGALAYILDPANKDLYKNKVRDVLLKWDDV